MEIFARVKELKKYDNPDFHIGECDFVSLPTIGDRIIIQYKDETGATDLNEEYEIKKRVFYDLLAVDKRKELKHFKILLKSVKPKSRFQQLLLECNLGISSLAVESIMAKYTTTIYSLDGNKQIVLKYFPQSKDADFICVDRNFYCFEIISFNTAKNKIDISVSHIAAEEEVFGPSYLQASD